ncbi:photosystem reaction center subunit H [Halobacteriales archaeon QS_1_68_17]|nr:MAG: photosystem reaction center subunit H [Halobacteriales archaeon QS_1_68_17]
MVDILAENLSGKAVTGVDGAQLGMLYNITMDLETGKLRSLIVEPDDDSRAGDFEVDENGRYRVPADRVQAIKDHMIIDR